MERESRRDGEIICKHLLLRKRRKPRSTLFPYTTLCRSDGRLDFGFQLARSAGVQVFLNLDGDNFRPVTARHNDPSEFMGNAGWLDGFAVIEGKPNFVGALNKTIPAIESLTQPAALTLRGDIDGDGTADAIYITQNNLNDHPAESRALVRSEERRVGKECRARWSP